MNDLVQRLRAFPGGVGAEALCREAADEIERLRRELSGYESWARSVNEALNSGDGSYRP